MTHRRAVPQPPCSSRLLLPRRGAIAMDQLRKRGRMRAFTATNVSEASGPLSRRSVPEVSGSRRNPSASEVSVPIPKWRSNVSQSSRPQNATLKPLESSRPQGRNSIARKTTASRRRVNNAARRRTLCPQLKRYGLEIVRHKSEMKRIKSEICMNRLVKNA